MFLSALAFFCGQALEEHGFALHALGHKGYAESQTVVYRERFLKSTKRQE